MTAFFDSILERIRDLVKNPAPRDAKLEAIATLLKGGVSHYDWVGFYLIGEKHRRELVLGPYAGTPTEHTNIPFGKGICGQAVDRQRTFIVMDVTKETNYLSCSPDVKSEILVPIFKKEEIAGELDIDSHQISPFTEMDREFCKA